MKVEGGCYCGAVRYQAEGDVMFRGQCHCRECQYISGGAENLVLGMPEADFAYTKGAAKQFRRSDLEQPVTREFCAECGTHLVSRAPGFPMAMIKVGTLDEPSQFEGSQMAVFTIDKQSFHHIPEGIATFASMRRGLELREPRTFLRKPGFEVLSPKRACEQLEGAVEVGARHRNRVGIERDQARRSNARA